MRRQDRYTFILWGDQFDETPAAIFVSELRDAGVLVKVVGLRGQCIPGIHGLALTPDIYLDEALRLAPQTACFIIPTTLPMLNPFAHDPRLIRFLGQVREGGARILVGGVDPAAADALVLSDEVEIYPSGETLFEFVRRLARAS